jgi:hypothetical protein
MPAPRCIVLVPYLTHIEPGCERGLRELEKRGLEVRRYPASAAIDRTRSEMATTVLAEGWDEIMWIDSDIVFEADDVARLRSHELPFVAGVYAKRGTGGLACHLEALATELRVGEGGGLVPVRYVGMGFVLARRQVFDDVATTFALPRCNTAFSAPVVPYFLPMVIEDARTAGGYWYLRRGLRVLRACAARGSRDRRRFDDPPRSHRQLRLWLGGRGADRAARRGRRVHDPALTRPPSRW